MTHFLTYFVFIFGFRFACSSIYTIYDAPSLSLSDQVEIYYLEASFPYNTPPSIKNAAGSSFDTYAVTHGGLGVWDQTTNVKFSIEFVSNDYIGGLIPTTSNGQLIWENQASIIITSPLVEDNWSNSRLITITTGAAYSQLITYLQNNINSFTVYQPVSVIYINESLYNSSMKNDITVNDLTDIGSLLVTPTSSFTFLDIMVSQLASYGCDLQSFLQIYASAFNYLSNKPKLNLNTQVVSWSSSGTVNSQVYQWFSDLNDCYTTVFDETVTNGEGAEYFLQAVQKCYSHTAYVYKSSTSVYNISLANYTDNLIEYSSPILSQYVYILPSSSSNDNEQLSIMDWFMIVLFILCVLFGIVYFLNRLFGKKQRRRVSFEGERIASNAVNNISANAGDNHDEKQYYQ
eukprot:gene7787-10578_t